VASIDTASSCSLAREAAGRWCTLELLSELVLGADPEPVHRVAFNNPRRAIVVSDANLADTAIVTHGLEVETGGVGVGLPSLVRLPRAILHIG